MTLDVPPRRDFRMRLLSSLMVLSFVMVGSKAHAEPSSSAQRTDEEALIGQGVELRKKGEDEAALGAFLKAYELSKGPRALAQVALAEQALGRWVDAEGHLGQALLQRDDPWIARNRSALEQAFGEIQGHVGSLALSGGVAGAEVRLNGAPVGSLPLKGPIRALAGSAALEVRAEGYLPVVRTVIIPNGGLARESVVLVATVPPAADARVVPSANPPPAMLVSSEEQSGAQSSIAWGARRKAALALGVAAVGGVAVGTAFLIKRESLAQDYNVKDSNGIHVCSTADSMPSVTCQSLRNREESAFAIGVVGFVGAALLGGVGALLFFTDHSADSGRVASERSSLAVRCLPGVGGGLACAGEF